MPTDNTFFRRYVVDVYGRANDEQYATVRNTGDNDSPAQYINNPQEIDNITTALAANSTFIQSRLSDDNQIRYIEMIGGNLADSILRENATQIMFDPDPRYSYSMEISGLQSSNNALQSGDCTYILEHANYPAMYKIGFTSDLYRRTYEIYSENNKIPVRLIAFIQTKRNIELETYLHMAFASHRKTGEWFQYKAIEQWLTYYKTDLTKAVKEEAGKETEKELLTPYIW